MYMSYQGINLENVKLQNRSSILRLINNNGAMSRKDIAEAVGLTAASVTLICTELLEEGVIVELGEAVEKKRAGRKKILVDINHDYKNVLCIAIEAEETYISLTNLKGEVLENKLLDTDKKSAPEVFLKNVTDECKKLLWEKDIQKDKIMAVAVTIPGKVDRAAGKSLNSVNVWTKEVPVADIIHRELGFKVVIENNLKAFAQSEIFFGQGRIESNILMLKWGPGVGSAIIVNQQIYEGAFGQAAEIGHITAVKNGRLCNCGRKGCLETYISTHALREGKNIPIEEIDISDDKIDLFAHNVRNAVAMMDPMKVVLFGYFFDKPGVTERFIQSYRQYDNSISDDFFAKSTLPVLKSHTEGLAVVMDEMFF